MVRPPRFAAAIEIFRSASWLTGARIRIIALVFLLFALAAIGADFSAHTTNGVIDSSGEHLARDFVNYWSGAKLAATERLADAYHMDWLHRYQRSLIGQNAEGKMYGYPPVAALLTLPLAMFDYIPALALWLVLGTGLCILLLTRTMSWPMAVLAALASPAVVINTLSGQNGHFSAALIAGGVLMIERRPVLSGVLFGALCYKPHLGVLLPLVLAAGGYRRAFAAAAATVAILVTASLALSGPDAWVEFFRQAPFQRLLMERGETFWHRMPTVFATLRLAGAGVPAAYAAQLLSAAAAAVAAIMVWRARCPVFVKGAALVVATMLVTPYGWDYDLVVLTFVVAWLVHDTGRVAFLPWERLGLTVLLIMPFVIGWVGKTTGIQLGALALWTVLGMILRRATIAGPIPARPLTPDAALEAAS